MRVKLLGEISGTRDGQQWPPRYSVLDLPDDEARQLVHQRMAAPVVEETAETAVVDEQAVEGRAMTTDDVPAAARRVRKS